MELTKYGGTEILIHIKHDLRQLPEGKSYGNESVDPELSGKNYSLINRGKTAKEVNQYRKDFESKIFKYNRKNLVHAIELVIQCPSDCPPEQHEAFFRTAFDWYCDKYLPAGKECVFVAEVHKDEHKWVETEKGLKDISKEHLHIVYVPAIPAGEKHPDYEYRLNADALTKRAILRDMHPSLQATLNEVGIKATVYQKKSGDGKTIPLSVKQLKEITNKTGITIKKSLTIDELADILKVNQDIEIKDKELQKKSTYYENKAIHLSLQTKEQEATISSLQENLQLRNSKIKKLETMLQKKSLAVESGRIVNQELNFKLNSLQRELSLTQEKLQTVETDKNEVLNQQNTEIRKLVESLQNQLLAAKEEIKELHQRTEPREINTTPSWGQSNTREQNSSWGDVPKKKGEETLW